MRIWTPENDVIWFKLVESLTSTTAISFLLSQLSKHRKLLKNLPLLKWMKIPLPSLLSFPLTSTPLLSLPSLPPVLPPSQKPLKEQQCLVNKHLYPWLLATSKTNIILVKKTHPPSPRLVQLHPVHKTLLLRPHLARGSQLHPLLYPAQQ